MKVVLLLDRFHRVYRHRITQNNSFTQPRMSNVDLIKPRNSLAALLAFQCC